MPMTSLDTKTDTELHSGSKLTDKEQFDLVYAALVDGYKEYRTTEGKVTGFFLLAIGWFLVSTSPFPILSDTVYAWAAVAWIAALIAVFAWVPVMESRRSTRRLRMLSKLNLVHESLYKDYQITNLQVALAILVHTSLQLALIVMIYDRYISP